MDIYLIVLLILFIAPISTIIHEFGHVLGAKSVNADSVTLSIGSGRNVWSFNYRRIQIRFHAMFFLGGVAYSERNIPYKPVEIVWITLCGPISSGLTAILIYICFGISNGFLQLLILFNSWLAIVNIIPFKIKGKQSDGYTIIQTISQNRKIKNKQ